MNKRDRDQKHVKKKLDEFHSQFVLFTTARLSIANGSSAILRYHVTSPAIVLLKATRESSLNSVV